MKQAIEIISAAVVAFVLTTLYLQHSQPNDASHQQRPTSADPRVRLAGKDGVVNLQVAPDYSNTRPKVSRASSIPASAAAPAIASPADPSTAETYEAEERELAEYWGGIRNV